MSYRLTCAMWLPRERGEVFRFFEDAWNLPRITPGWLGFRILTEKIELRAGCEIDYWVRWGVPMRWRTLIEVYEPPHRFVDRQIRGPYNLWSHLHSFSEVEGGTLIEDTVEYVPPMGVLGRVVHWAMIRRNLVEIFEHRQRETARLILGGREGAREVRPVMVERVD